MINLLRKMFGKSARPPGRERLSLVVEDFGAIYAVGDIHGCLAEYLAVEKRILADAAGEPGQKLLVLLGDYIDRGPRSKDVLDYLGTDAPHGFTRVALCGNHDDAFLQWLRNPAGNMAWLEFGGHQTLHSYGINADHILRHGGGIKALGAAALEVVPDSHITLLETLPVLLEMGKLLFVHAGIRPKLALDEQLDEDLMWIREPFLSDGPGGPWLVVHGHTVDKEPVFGNSRIGIDTGAFMSGRLTVLKIVGDEVEIL